MKFKVGQKLRVKSREDILATLGIHGDAYDKHGRLGVNWNDGDMREYCGREAIATGFETWGEGHAYTFKDFNEHCHWIFEEDWLELAKPKVRLPEELFNV